MEGFTDQYDMEINPNPDVKPTFPDDGDDSKPNVPSPQGLKWAFIGIGISFIVLLIITIACCMRKQARAKSYEYKTYGNKESVEKLDSSQDLDSSRQMDINR